MIYTDASILVIPLAQKLFGQEYVIYTSAFIMVQIILLWTHCKSLLCGEQKIDWKKNVDDASAWIAECRKLGIVPTTTQLQNHFGWTQTVASKVKAFIAMMESKESLTDGE